MRKIQRKISIPIGQYKSIERWGDTYWMDDYTSQQGELIQFYKGGYTLFCLGNNVRLDIAANKPFNAVVGDCLCGVGKVVHTLPLPPPRSKRMSEIIKVNQLIKKQKWKYIS